MKTVIVEPRAYHLNLKKTDFSEFKDNWEWVYVPELVECLESILESRGRKVFWKDPRDLLERFVLLNKKILAAGFFTWASEASCCIHGKALPEEKDVPVSAIYIPKPWAKNIIGMVKEGIEMTEARRYPHQDQSIAVYDVHGIDARGRAYWIHHLGGDRWKLIR